MDDRLSQNSLSSVGKSMFLCVPVFVLDGTLRTDLRILSDPYEKSWHSYKKNVTPRNVIGCVAVLFRSRVSVSFIFSALSRVPARSHFSHLNFSLSTCAQPPPNPPGLIPGHYLFSPWICRYTIINIYEVPALCCLLPVSPVRCPSA